MLTCQKDKFSLPEDVSYLNCAYFSPLLNHVEEIGFHAISRKRRPYEITIDDFFKPVEKLKKVFSELINNHEYQRISLIPGVSYGVANIAKNISLGPEDNIVIVSEQFPSNVYSWVQRAKETEATIKIISPSEEAEERGKAWNENILNAIDEQTRLVAIANVHWADGTLFYLKSIRKKCDAHGTLLVIDGSQSVGALPISVSELNPDALICAGYKWLLGPYSLGLAYFGEKFDNGQPIEECWINREASEDFQNLVNYQESYKPFAGRYNVSESSNFILVPMLSAAIEQLLEWSPRSIQEYCYHISSDALVELKAMGCLIEEKAYRASHLFGIRLTSGFDLMKLKKTMTERKVYVSFRGNAIRVAPHLYNTKNDFDKLVECIKSAKK